MNTVLRRTIGIAVAVIAGIGGLWWFLLASEQTLRSAGTMAPQQDWGSLVLPILPALLVAIAGMTLALSRFGVILVGTALAVVGVIGAISFQSDLAALSAPARTSFLGLSLPKLVAGYGEVQSALLLVLISGTVLMLALALLVTGLFGGRPSPRSPLVIAGGLVSAVPLVAGVVLTGIGATGVWQIFRTLQAPTGTSVTLVILGAFVFALGLVMTPWSEAGLYLAGAVLVIGQLIGAGMSVASLNEYQLWLPVVSGLPGLVGLTLLGLAVGAHLRRRRTIAARR